MEPSTTINPAMQETPNEIIALEDIKPHPLFKFMGLGSLIYAFFYTLFLYHNGSGITYPFFVGGTCLFFFLYLRKSGITAKKFSVFITAALILLGISTCLTDSWVLIFLNKLGIFCLFFYLSLHSFYEDKSWNLMKYAGAITRIVCSSLLYLFSPFADLAAFERLRRQEQNKEEGKGKYVVIGALIALPLLLVILLLLSSADAVFSHILSRTLTFDFSFFDHIWGYLFLFLFAFFASYCLMSRLSERNLEEITEDKRTAEPIIGITVTAIISLVYLLFCGIQIVYLFAGLGTLPEHYTYASYAREGFFQLVFVCLINLALVLICTGRFRENKILKVILTFISGCTYIMIASSVYRMLLYIDVYHLTFLRVFVLWALLVISVLMAGALAVIYRQNFPFVKYCVCTVTVLYLIFSFARPDSFIASYNLKNSYDPMKEETCDSFYDYAYLRQLSLDAAPVILSNSTALGYEYNHWFINYQKEAIRNEPSSLRKWNYSRWRAATLCNTLFGKEYCLYLTND